MKVKLIKNILTTEYFLYIFTLFFLNKKVFFALKITHRVAEHKNCSTTIQHEWKSKSDTTTENMREILFISFYYSASENSIVRRMSVYV